MTLRRDATFVSRPATAAAGRHRPRLQHRAVAILVDRVLTGDVTNEPQRLAVALGAQVLAQQTVGGVDDLVFGWTIALRTT